MNLITPETRIKVSSVLNRDTANYGKQHLVDGSEETCWNSDQQSPQYIALDFGRPVKPATIQLMFQGGFVGRVSRVLGAAPIATTVGPYTELAMFYPEDINALQISFGQRAMMNEHFQLPPLDAPIQRMKIVFEESSDHYGRITVYRLEVLGHAA
ncbi:hypothetical protein SYNPS1DRAFT_14072 [Syncephalis pseudoplumigaleata]|uniref:F5/8 type C domain-containing protein n=1 Tax=Syncephalis pseudoplumigaleata TaxID=1712513 RepID=A0A4P9Z2E9_9FUNG|nr:hypothetical protein SYNPS1DRAFT_14072 [Syncephalis pseudoplumigaleata]|eukprot:RKP26528.1 hypothetical protein SYNPS1DRAFT_14072 [Syncephalis pseudoplumigaleata]